MSSRPIDLSINSQRVTRVLFFSLLIFEIILVLADAFLNHYRYGEFRSIRTFFNMAREDSFSNWFSSIQALFTGLILWIIVFFHYKTKKLRVSRWGIIALFFTYIAIDDGCKVHERLGTVFKEFIKNNPSTFSFLKENIIDIFPSYLWHIVLGPFFIGMGIYMLWFLYQELKDKKLLKLLLAAIFCYALAVLLDFTEGIEGFHSVVSSVIGSSKKFASHFSLVFEEFLELLGTSFFLVLFTRYLFQSYPQVSLNFSRQEQEKPIN